MISSAVKESTTTPGAERLLPPEAKGWPLLGVLPALLRDPFGFLARARATYGDIYTLNLGFTKLIICNHPSHAQHLLRDHTRNYVKEGALWQSMRSLVGNGLIVSDGDFWLRQRRLMQPQFHRQRLAGLTHLMGEAIQEVLATWETAATSDQPFDLTPALSQLTMRVVLKTLFGTALNGQALDEVAQEMAFAINYVFVDAAGQALPRWVPLPKQRRYQQALARFDEAVYRIIADGRRTQGTAGASEHHLLAMLLDTVDAETDARMDDRQLRDEVATLFLAGYETTSIALAWVFAYLTHYPQVMQKAQAEVDGVLGERQPTFADLPNLPYSRMILQEVMRIRPPAYWTPRTAVAEDIIDGYTIPAGATVVPFIYMVHHHPDVWSAPEQFDPERFTPENSAGRHPFAWIPFGAGPRLCIGRDFALMEGQLALIMALQRYRLLPAQANLPALSLASTLRPKGGVMVKLMKRNS